MKPFLSKMKLWCAKALQAFLSVFSTQKVPHIFYMAVPAASGHPQYSGTFIPSL